LIFNGSKKGAVQKAPFLLLLISFGKKVPLKKGILYLTVKLIVMRSPIKLGMTKKDFLGKLFYFTQEIAYIE